MEGKGLVLHTDSCGSDGSLPLDYWSTHIWGILCIYSLALHSLPLPLISQKAWYSFPALCGTVEYFLPHPSNEVSGTDHSTVEGKVLAGSPKSWQAEEWAMARAELRTVE